MSLGFSHFSIIIKFILNEVYFNIEVLQFGGRGYASVKRGHLGKVG